MRVTRKEIEQKDMTLGLSHESTPHSDDCLYYY